MSNRKSQELEISQTRLFRKDVYKQIAKKLYSEGGIEVALTQIRNDKTLQRAIKDYAKRNGIKYIEVGNYGIPYIDDKGRDKFVDKNILIWTDNKKKRPSRLIIGPDPTEIITPIVLWYWDYLPEGDTSQCFFHPSISSNYYPPGWYNERCYIKKMKNGYYLEGHMKSEKYHDKRITEFPGLSTVTTKEVLSNLERSIAKIIER